MSAPGARDDTESGPPALQPEIFNQRLHDARSFSCGNASLDDYIRETVLRDLAQGTAAACVWTRDGDTSPSRPILGYFTLSGCALERRQTRRRDRDRFLGAYHPIPAILIGRLALDLSLQGQGLGSALVSAAMLRIHRMQAQLGVATAVVHAVDDRAAAFQRVAEYLIVPGRALVSRPCGETSSGRL